jgi:uncharacterized protein DUF6174
MLVRWPMLGVLLAACHHTPPQRADVTPPAADTTHAPPLPPLPPLPPSQRRTTGPLTPAERDSLVREVQARRAAWRARGIADYDLRVAVGCFCPWPGNPAVLEVRHGAIVALRDTAGKRAGPVREPWSLYSVEGLFDAVEQSARRVDVLEVRYDPTFGYPASIRGDGKLGLPDDWFWVTADRLTPSKR